MLSKARIVAATGKVIDADGIDAVSMRSVARILGVDAKSLYNHVDGKDGLLDAVAEDLLGSIDLPDRTGQLDVDLRGVAQAFRRQALAQPEVASLVLTRQLSSLEGLAPTEAVLAVLREAGIGAQESVHLLRALLAMLIGTLLREVNAGPTYGTADRAGIAERTAVLRDAGLPAVVAAAPVLATFDADREFDYVVRLALEAVTAARDRESR